MKHREPKPKTFPELALLWLDTTGGHRTEDTVRRYETAILAISQNVKSVNGDLRHEIRKWEKARRAELEPAGFVLELGLLKAVLNWGRKVYNRPREDAGWNEIHPTPVPRRSFPVPTREQFASILAAVREQANGAHAADFIEFLGASGLRKGEAYTLQWRDVDFDAGTVLVGRGGNTKNHTERLLPMFERLRAVLERLRDRTDIEYRQPEDLVWGEVRLEYRLTEASKKLGLPHYRVHDLRHFFATQALRAVGIENAHCSAAWCGHNVMVHLERYTAHVDGNQSAELAKLLK